MQLLMSFGDTRRARRRQAYLGTVRLVATGLLVLAGAVASYYVGRSQSRVEIARLRADLSALQELNRLLTERAANAEQRAEAEITKTARLRQDYAANVPRGDVREMLALVEAKLRDGVPAERLAFLLREARVERRCEPATETKRLPVHTAAATVPPSTIAFAKDRISISAEGTPTRKPGGGTESAFDPTQPVALRFLKIGRDVAKVEGRLPVSHALVLGDQEYLFLAKPSDKAAGQVEVVAQVCAYP
jgi:hypothetical protein